MHKLTFKVEIRRARGKWIAKVPEAEATASDRTLAGVDAELRESLVLAQGLPETAGETLTLEYELRELDHERMADLRALRERHRRVGQSIQQGNRWAVKELLKIDKDISLRDMAFITGMTYQRVSQIKQEVEEKLPDKPALDQGVEPGRVTGVAADNEDQELKPNPKARWVKGHHSFGARRADVVESGRGAE